jgi:signal transduction histidine kinase
MKRRLFFFHTAALIAALVILLAVNGGVVHLVSGYYRQHAVPAADGRSERVQAILDSWGAGDTDWIRLSRSLEKFDCGLAVSVDRQVVYSSLNQIQDDLYRRVAKEASWPEQGTLTVQNDGVVLIGRQEGSYTLVAMPRPDIPPVFGRQRPQGEAMLLAMLASGAAAIGIIVLFSLVFTHYQVKHILRPVNALAEAARRVEAGDLTTPVGYRGQDEFSSVCTAFDHMQQHLLAEREKSASYERSRTDLVAGISHDLRTPLTSVKGYIKGLRDGVAQTPEKQEQYLDVAYRKACDMDVLLQRLFYFSKLETGNLPLFPERVDLGDFVRQFAADARGELAAKGGRIQVSVSASPHPVCIDTEQMYRVLTNLTENALRYAGAESLCLRLTVQREGAWERLLFADNGAGVPEDQLPRLFEQFWRRDQARGSSGGESSGLGLYIVKYIVEAHGGTVRAKNDKGLVFELMLPCPEESV